MKRTAVALLFLILVVALMISASATDEKNCSIDAVRLSADNSQLIVEATLTSQYVSDHDIVYLFRVSPQVTSIDALTPIAEASVSEGERAITLTVPYDNKDASLALYGYRLATANETGDYFPITETVYRSDIGKLSPHTQAYPTVSSKKGLQVQLSTDAQLLGVKHTTVSVFFNELISYQEDKSVAFLYGGSKYYLNSAALTALDYTIRSLTDAGIHVYINCLLAFDTTASSELYYREAEGNSSTLFAPNVSDAAGLRRYAAVLHFLADRYSEEGAPNGFCGSFILGYEVNEEGKSNSAGISKLKDYVEAYATYLRIADTAVRTAYQNARVFVSLSNRFCIPDTEEEPYLFGSYEFLTELAKLCPTVPFGVSINPYPSSLSNTAFWNDPEAIDSLETPYLTMKNLSVLTDLMATDALRCQGQLRPLIVGEFGVSGKPGSDSETLQAAAYLYAYSLAQQNTAVEAFLWHRHVDHAAETDLYYGLYAASDLLLEPSTPKLLHTVFGAVDRADGGKICQSYLSLWPEHAISELPPALRTEITLEPIKLSPLITEQNRELLFDFSKSLYGFYPTDNTSYLEIYEENNSAFMRVALLPVSSFEHMGIGTVLSDLSRLRTADILTLRVRVISPSKTAQIRLRLSGEGNEGELIFDASAEVPCNVWTDVSFSLDSLQNATLSDAKLRLWTRVGAGTEKPFLDVSAMTLSSEKATAPLLIAFSVLIAIAILSLLLFLLFLLVIRVLRRRQ